MASATSAEVQELKRLAGGLRPEAGLVTGAGIQIRMEVKRCVVRSASSRVDNSIVVFDEWFNRQDG